MRGLNGERTRPSPCSEELTPSKEATRSTTSSATRCQRLDLVGPREVDERPDVQAADRAVAVEAGGQPVRARRIARNSRDVVDRAARAPPRCPRRTPPAACGPRWRPSAARARPCGPWSARPARRRSRRAACGSRGRARATRARAGRACRAPRRRVSPEKETNSSASGSPSRRSASVRYSSLERERSRIVRSISSTALGSSASASSVAAIAASSVVEVPDREHLRLRQLDELHGRRGDDRERPLGADDQLREVERVHAVEPVAARLAPVARVVLGDRPRVVAQDRLHAVVDAGARGARGARALRERGARAVGEHDLELEHVVDRRAVHDRLAARRSCCRSCRRASPGSTSRCPARSRARGASRRG